jgi:hypothetical protein
MAWLRKTTTQSILEVTSAEGVAAGTESDDNQSRANETIRELLSDAGSF